MSTKGKFPDELSLSNFIRENSASYAGRLQSAIGHLEEEYKTSLKNRRKAAVKFGAAGIIFFAVIQGLDANFGTYGLLVLGILFLVSVLLLIKGWRQIKGTSQVVNRFNIQLNKELFPLVFSLFAVKAGVVEHSKKNKEELNNKYKKRGESFWQRGKRLAKISTALRTTPEYDEVMGLLNYSELITEPRNTVVVDDIVTGDYQGKTICLSELDAKHVTGSGKNRRVKHIFHGYFVSLDLDINLEGKTFVSTEGDKRGFGHQSFWKNIGSSNNSQVEVTELEWNDFENLLHVATNNPSEARYVLSPDFMQDLYAWWKEKKQNIRVSFLGSRMYLLFPDKRVKLSRTVKNLSAPEVIKYTESIALPLLHVMHLAEDTSEQFNHS